MKKLVGHEVAPETMEQAWKRLYDDTIARVGRMQAANAMIADIAIGLLQDGEIMAMQNSYGGLIRILAEHVGEAGRSEDAVDCLKRIVRERNAALSLLRDEGYHDEVNQIREDR